MDKKELKRLIADTFGVQPDYPWEKYPDYEAFRHRNNKWFALIMSVPKSKIGADGDGNIDIVNLKCDPLMLGSLLSEKGFYPAYHMNKKHWLSAALDGSADDELIKTALDISYKLTE